MDFLKRILIILVLFLIYTCICAFSYANNVSSDISNNVLRLHILANSDSDEDQNLKLKIRDNILAYMRGISNDIHSKEDAISLVEEKMDMFEGIAMQTIYEEGYDYPVNIQVGNFDFPTKDYGSISLPSGKYDALRIEIGEANGHNWWCVMFPSLCFVDVSSDPLDEKSKEMLENSLNEEEYKLISEDDSVMNFKFKILEFFDDMRIKLANK